MRFSVIIPVFNERLLIPRCLPTVVQTIREHGDAELIVVDNGSTDGSHELLERDYADVATLARLPGATIGAVRNHGARLARGSVLSFLDADFSIPSDYLRRAERVLEDIRVAATGAHYVLPDDASRVERAWFSMHPRREAGFVHYIPSGNFMVRREAFDRTGGFSETLETGEDAEFCLRLRDAGFRIFESSTLAGVHHGNAKTLPEFFRKEVWRGLGMFGTVGGGRLDKPTSMLFAFLALVAVGIVLLGMAIVRGDPWLGVGWFVAFALPVPFVTAAYRWRSGRRITYPFLSVVLYFVYYVARARALVSICRDALRRRPVLDHGGAGDPEEGAS